jgi:sodium/proline symporter
MNPIVLIFLVFYYVVVVAIGFIAVRKKGTKDLEGYFLGGRQVSPIVTAMTLQATSMSGYMFLGAGSEGYRAGYWSIWYAVGDIGGGIVNLSLIGRRMRKLSQILGSLTSIGYLENRYPHPATRLVAGTLSILFLFFYVLAQFIAGGKGMALVTGLPYWASLLIAVGIILLYLNTYLGGYFAIAWTEFFQSLIMLLGVLWIISASFKALGGFTKANEALAALDPTILSIWGRGLQYKNRWGEVAGAVLIFSVGYMGWPHVVVRHMAMTKPSSARLAGVYSILWNLLFVTSPYLVGIMALLIVPEIADPEMAIFEVSNLLLPPAVVGVVMASIMAAIMSTSGSILLQVGTVASRDLYQRYLDPKATDKRMVLVSRLFVLAVGAVGIVVALVKPPGVFSIVVFTTSVLGSAFLPSYFCAVWWKKANAPGAIASMIGGGGMAFFWRLSGAMSATAVHPMFAGLIVSIILIVVVSLATQKSHPVPSHIVRAMEASSKLEPIPKELYVRADHTLSPEAKEIGDQIQ